MATLAEFARYLEECGIVAPDKLKSVMASNVSLRTAGDLARELVKQNRLTRFQAQQVYEGKARQLVMGNYTLLDKLGAGGMGQVYKARHRRMDRIVAVKMLPPEVVKDAAAQARFQREVFAAAKLAHPNIVAAFDADLVGDAPFLVMEYVDGIDLAALVRRSGPLSIAKALGCALQTARGLDYAHRQGIIHRDIKPANLLVDKTGRIKILDMGLARIEATNQALVETQSALTSAGSILGTIDYMAPEQAIESNRADQRSDIYSLGCTLYFLLSGKAVYDGDTLIGKLLAHREKPVPSLVEVQPQVPAALDEVFRRMVAKNPDDRFQSMGEVILALQNFGKPPSGISSVPPTVSEEQFAAAPRSGGGSGSGGGRYSTFPTPASSDAQPAVRLTGAWPRRKIGMVAACVGAPLLIGAAILLRSLGGSSAGGDHMPGKPMDQIAASAIPAALRTGEPSGAQNDPTRSIDLDRQVAQWVRKHGTFALKVAVGNDSPRDIKADSPLPKSPFKVVKVTVVGEPISEAELLRLGQLSNLSELWLERVNLTDAMLANLPFLPKLSTLGLANNAGIGDEGMKQLARQTELRWLDASATSLTVQGLVYLHPLANLNRLELNGTPLTDTDLIGLQGQHLKALNLDRTKITDDGLRQLPTLLVDLRQLSIKETSTTEAGVEALKQALPNCLVAWSSSGSAPSSGSTPSPPIVAPVANTDRAVADWVFSVQGNARLTVSEGGESPHVQPPGRPLPETPFKIVEIAFFDAQLSNADFSRLSSLTELQRLAIQRCDVSDAMLATLPSLAKLTDLDLSDSRHMTDASLKVLGERVGLRKLDLSNTGIGAAGIRFLRPLVSLESLNLSRLADINGDALAQLSALPKLRRLELGFTSIDDADLSQLKAQKIQDLNLRQSKVTDDGLKRLPENLPHLQWIDLSGTTVTAAGITAFEKGEPRCIIDWTPPHQPSSAASPTGPGAK
jgi:serine/threonine protein kinase/uncharacterized protein YjbI with pentapeptide repeats